MTQLLSFSAFPSPYHRDDSSRLPAPAHNPCRRGMGCYAHWPSHDGAQLLVERLQKGWQQPQSRHYCGGCFWSAALKLLSIWVRQWNLRHEIRRHLPIRRHGSRHLKRDYILPSFERSSKSRAQGRSDDCTTKEEKNKLCSGMMRMMSTRTMCWRWEAGGVIAMVGWWKSGKRERLYHVVVMFFFVSKYASCLWEFSNKKGTLYSRHWCNKHRPWKSGQGCSQRAQLFAVIFGWLRRPKLATKLRFYEGQKKVVADMWP